MFRSFSDLQTAEMLNLPRPKLKGGKPVVVACPMSDERHELQQELVERCEQLRSQKLDPRVVDNALAITTDGRKLAIDARMLSPTALDFPESKVNRLVKNVLSIWQETSPTRGTLKARRLCRVPSRGPPTYAPPRSNTPTATVNLKASGET